MKKVLMLYAVLAFALRASGQSQGVHPLGVVIEGWHYDPVQKAVILHLVNHSHKDVTAFNISIAEKYADGSTDHTDGTPSDIHDHQVMEDMLGALIQQQLTKNEGRGHGVVWFAAGTSREYMIPEAKDIADIEAVVDVIAYADGSADVLDNDRAFQNVVAERKGSLLAMEKANDVIKRALADPMVSDPLSAALNELLPFAESLDAKTKNRSPEVAENNVARNLQGHIQNLQSMQQEKMSETAKREALSRYVDDREKWVALMKPHCELERTQAK